MPAPPLYTGEDDYAGAICLHPDDPNTGLISANVSRRCLRGEQSAPTDVGGYTLLVTGAECEISGLPGPGEVSKPGAGRVAV